MSMVDAIMKRQEEFKSKYARGGGGGELWTKDGDIVYFHIIKDDTAFGEVYVAHGVPVEGSQYDKLVYCPMYSFHDDNAAQYACPYDATDKERPDGSPMYPLKQRILFWLYVHKVLRKEDQASDQDKQLPIEDRGGTKYRVREYDKPVLWEVSGWQRFSPMTDFNILRENMGGDLTTKMLTMRQSGKGLDMIRRFDVLTDSGPLDEQRLATALDVKPIRAVLMDRLQEGQQSGGTVSRSAQSAGWNEQKQAQADQTMKDAGHTQTPPPAPPAQVAVTEQSATLPPASDPEGFDPKKYAFDPEDPFGN